MASKKKKEGPLSHAFVWIGPDHFRCSKCGVELSVRIKRARHHLFFRKAEGWQTEPISCA